MRTAIDTSVLLDILLDDQRYAERSRVALAAARERGALIVCDVVVAELGPALTHEEARAFLDELTIQFVPNNISTALLAGEMMSEHVRRGGKKGRIVPDFLVGAHAKNLADRLLARDRGYLRDYFKNLNIVSP